MYAGQTGIMTELFVSQGKFTKNALAGRVVRSGDQWGVVKSNGETDIQIWGNFSGKLDFEILPAYQLQ